LIAQAYPIIAPELRGEACLYNGFVELAVSKMEFAEPVVLLTSTIISLPALVAL